MNGEWVILQADVWTGIELSVQLRLYPIREFQIFRDRRPRSRRCHLDWIIQINKMDDDDLDERWSLHVDASVDGPSCLERMENAMYIVIVR